jgi:hypothetical protein
MDEGRTGDLVFYAFDLLFLDGTSTMELPLIERKARLEPLFATAMPGLCFSDHIIGDGKKFREHACRLSLEGAVSKRLDRPYAPGDRGLWVKSKCLNREEFVVVGWTDPTGLPTASAATACSPAPIAPPSLIAWRPHSADAGAQPFRCSDGPDSGTDADYVGAPAWR